MELKDKALPAKLQDGIDNQLPGTFSVRPSKQLYESWAQKPNEGLPKNNPEVRENDVLSHLECFTDFPRDTCVFVKANT